MLICTRCERKFEKLVSLSIHFRSAHESTAKQLYVELYCEGVEPNCACGCGEETKFHSIKTGFSEYKWGHASRINNNWGHNSNTLAKSHQTRRENLASGKTTVWNKGLDKADDRIMKQINRMIEKRNEHHDDWRIKISKTHAENHVQDGSINNHTFGNGSHFDCTKNLKTNRVYCRSLYEKNFYEWLERDNNVKYYINEPFRIEYLFENKSRNYVIDSLVKFKDKNKETLVEVKATWQLENPKNKAKFTAAQEFALANDYDFEIWTQETHDFLGIK